MEERAQEAMWAAFRCRFLKGDFIGSLWYFIYVHLISLRDNKIA